VGFIGQIHPAKGVDLLLDAIVDLINTRNVDPDMIELQLHGNVLEPGYAAALQLRIAQINDLGLKTHLKGVYSPSSTGSLLCGLDVVVIPSLWPESYCLTADEAILSGARVICANLPSILERIKPSPAVRFFETGSVLDLKRALLDCFATVHEEVAAPSAFVHPMLSYGELYERYEGALYR
jgi:glycosyltransferase involved in cell wall biosynthesis